MPLDLIGTLALAGLALAIGYGIRRVVPALAHYNVPAPILGGLLIALTIYVARTQRVELFRFDTVLQTPLMIAFFTTIGFTASLRMLRTGGPLVLRFFALAALFAVVQNLLGIAIALGFGLDPLFGVLAGSVTLAGGPATGLAFAPLFEQAGVVGAASVAVAVAMGGIVLGGLVGGPIATALMARHRIAGGEKRGSGPLIDPRVPADELVAADGVAPDDEDSPDAQRLMRNVIAVLLAMWLGGWLSAWFKGLGITLPAYIGAMLVAALIRNVDDATQWVGLSPRFVGEFGAVTLSLFLGMAIMTLKLWELAGLALPILVMLVAQVLVTAVFTVFVVFRAMGRDYESAVMSGGFVGFMLGTTANAMAVMRALVERYGPAPTAFLVAPMVGAFFIDFANALVITFFLNVFG
jgi:ESS family glutamate:Na+ symporter